MEAVAMHRVEVPSWPRELQATALREGWYLTFGPLGGPSPWVVRHVALHNALWLANSTTAPALPDLQTAWLRVMRGHQWIHSAARAFLQQVSPAEYARIAKHAEAHPPAPGIETEFPAFGPLAVPVPTAWEDRSDRADACPKFVRGAYTLWVDFADAALSVIRETRKRFVLEQQLLHGHEMVFETHDWPAMHARMQAIKQGVFGV